MTDKTNFEVIIVGGSYAGLSSAMALGRSLRNTLVIDSGKPCNATTPHSHNFITRDGSTPAEIAAIARQQVAQYPAIQFYNGVAVKGEKTNTGFTISTAAGDVFSSRKLVFATGIKDELPNIKGLAACWGISAIHCPYCHGYEFRQRRTAILANGDIAMHLAPLVSNLTNNLTLLTNGQVQCTDEQLQKLQKNNIAVIETELAELVHENGHLQHLLFKDGTVMPMDALYVKASFSQHSAIPLSLGCELTEQGHIKTDGFQKTTIPGVFACGDNSSMMRSVASAVACGNIAGAMVNKELVDEQF